MQRNRVAPAAPTSSCSKPSAAADQANQAKSRYITAISHELRTPLNSILGYAQLLDDDAAMPPHRQQAVSVIRRGGDHLLSLIEGTLDIARIEGGKLTLDVQAAATFPTSCSRSCACSSCRPQPRACASATSSTGGLPARGARRRASGCARS